MKFNENISTDVFKNVREDYPLFDKETYDRVKNMSWDEFVTNRKATIVELESI
jgi:hypothetical protein